MSNTYLYLLIALLAGAMMPTQAATNSKMAAFVDSPILAAFISFFVGTVALFAYLLLSGASLTNLAGVRDAPLIAWAGGLTGAFFVAAAVSLVPRLGVAMTFSLIVAGQMIVMIVIDHFGFLGVEVRPVNWQRIAGILLITGGVILIRRF
jgi:bacterial/archaeal transporter family-2 protein